MKAYSKYQNAKKSQQQYKPVKPFAFEAWRIWNNLTTSAELLWDEYEDDFIQFCCNNTQVRRKNQSIDNFDPF